MEMAIFLETSLKLGELAKLHKNIKIINHINKN